VQPEIIRVACDGCQKLTDVDDLEWTDGTALCSECLGREPIPDEIRSDVVYFPLYFQYDADNTLLHITEDLGDAERWRYQGERWWFWRVAHIIVKFFDSEAQVLTAKNRLIEKLEPRYLAFPDPETDLGEDIDPRVYAIEPGTKSKPMENILTLRVSREMENAIVECAVADGSRKPRWLRSVIYDAVRKSQAERHVDP
jgi:hypothetical protein